MRVSSVAVSRSSTPSIALRRTSEESSWALRAPESSSFGSMPMRRSTAFAVRFSTPTAGRKTAVKPDLERHHEPRDLQRAARA